MAFKVQIESFSIEELISAEFEFKIQFHRSKSEVETDDLKLKFDRRCTNFNRNLSVWEREFILADWNIESRLLRETD